jgi:hypothetical protein
LFGSITEITKVAAGLFALPSLTISCATYIPARSATKEVATDVVEVRLAVLPLGEDSNAHEYVSESPSASLEAPPSRLTDEAPPSISPKLR